MTATTGLELYEIHHLASVGYELAVCISDDGRWWVREAGMVSDPSTFGPFDEQAEAFVAAANIVLAEVAAEVGDERPMMVRTVAP